LPLKRRLAKPALVLIALAGLAIALSACAIFKEGSLQVSQPTGIGTVRVHFALCTGGEASPGAVCHQNEESGQSQYMLGIAVPPGWAAPATITAQPVGGGLPIVYTRNDEVAEAIAPGPNPEEPWPPAGTETVGYLSAVFDEETGANHDWTVDIDFGIPNAAGGGSYAPLFKASIATGWRRIDGSHPADREINCFEVEPGPDPDSSSWCEVNEEKEIGTSDLKIPAPGANSAYVGGKGTVAFLLDFGSTATTLPSFSLATTTTLPKATLALSSPTFVPAPPDPATHRSSGTGTVNVTVPKTAKPGVYDVTLTATTAQGGSVSGVGKLQVTKPKIKLGRVKLNKAKGTAVLSVKVPAAGTLTASGKGLAKAKKKTKKARTLKIPIKPNAKTKALLAEEGQAKVKAKISFKPTGAAAVVKSKGIVLKQS
jgi:hypothetical protein